MSAIADVLWPGMQALEPKSKLGGITAFKRGYHAPRSWLLNNGYTADYSVVQFAVDREGPGDQASAIDWTFPDAQAGDYRTIAKYSKRLLTAGMAGRDVDPRTIYMREFFGNADLDLEVEGWDFAKNRASSSDISHRWHTHISVHRKYINDAKAMRAILSILSGQSVGAWKEAEQPVTMQTFTSHLPILKRGMSDPVVANGTAYIKRAQKQLGVTVDGDYGPATAAAVAALGVTGHDGNTIDLPVWEKLFAIWGAVDSAQAAAAPRQLLDRHAVTDDDLPAGGS